MSIKVMTMVDDSGLKPSHKHVLHAYADRADDSGMSVFPGEEEVVWKTSYAVQTVRNVTRELLDLGVLVQVKRGHRGQRAEFRIDLGWLKASHLERLSSQKASRIRRESLSNTKESLSNTKRKPLATGTPNVIDPSGTVIEPSLVEIDGKRRQRDLLWEAVVDIHGEPATDSERGKLNRAVGDLRKAGVDEVEYAALVSAFMTKYTRNGQPGPQPTAMTIATRIGEMRHFLTRGPIQAPAGTLDDVVAEQKRRHDLAELEERYGEDGKKKQRMIGEAT